MRYLGFYLHLAPDDTEALITQDLAAEVLAESPTELFRVYLMLERALRQDSSNRAVRRELIDLAMELRRFTDAIAHLQTLLQKSPGDTELHSLLGECNDALGRNEAAAKACELAIDANPHEVVNYERLARLWSERLDRSFDAGQLLDQMVSKNKRSAAAYAARSRHR